MKAIYSRAVFRIIYRVQIIFLVIISFESEGFAQKTKSKTKVRMSLDYYNNADKSRSLDATLYFVQDRIRKPVSDEIIFFYIGDISENIILDSIMTDGNGTAQIKFDEDYNFSLDEERTVNITAVFKGNKSFTSAKSDISLKDIFMELFLSEINGLKTVSVRAYEIGNDKEMVPVENTKINFYVPRLFSDQLIGESKFNEGKSSIEFPNNIAGDTIGNISIIARIEDHDNYGTVARQLENFRWGNTEPIEDDKSLMTIQINIPTRALWHSNAPMWMIVTLVILLTGVWSHYMYVIYQLVKLHQLGKKKKINIQEGI